MTAATIERQPCLAGMEAAAQAPALDADALPMLVMRGLLEGHGLLRTVTDGQLQIELLVRQHADHHPRAVPLFVVYRWPDAGGFTATHEEASRFVARLLDCTDVMVAGRGLEIRHHHGREVLRLMRVDRLALWDSLGKGTTP